MTESPVRPRITSRHRIVLAAAASGRVTQTVTPGFRRDDNVTAALHDFATGEKINVSGIVAALIAAGYARRSTTRVGGNAGSLYGTWLVEPTAAGCALIDRSRE